MDGRETPLMDRKVVGVVLFGVVAQPRHPQQLTTACNVVWCNCACTILPRGCGRNRNCSCGCNARGVVAVAVVWCTALAFAAVVWL